MSGNGFWTWLHFDLAIPELLNWTFNGPVYPEPNLPRDRDSVGRVFDLSRLFSSNVK